jgi:hypothetical protein
MNAPVARATQNHGLEAIAFDAGRLVRTLGVLNETSARFSVTTLNGTLNEFEPSTRSTYAVTTELSGDERPFLSV